MLSDLLLILERDLDGLRAQIERYPDDASLWQASPGGPNAGGTLVLHLAGNLRHFVGAQLGGTGYVRQREAEFTSRGLSRQELLALVASARTEVRDTLSRLDPAALERPTTLPGGGEAVPTRLWLLHLATHLAYHLGQLDFHRRAVTGDSSGAGAVSVRALSRAASS
jgi:uncharacterized damage-inducible protein DinB